MVSQVSRRASQALGIAAALFSTNCNNLLNLNEFKVSAVSADAGETPPEEPECTVNRDCGSDASNPGYCNDGTCVPLLSEHCDTITGDATKEHAVIIGSLFSTKSATQGATNIQRQQAAILAVQQVNDANGIPLGVGAETRELVLVSCDESTDLEAAISHLVDDLHVPAIIGPNTSQDTVKANGFTAQAGTLVITPTAVASGIVSLNDNGLTWLMVPTDVQRAPLMIQQINALESQLRSERARETIRLGVVYRDDQLGKGTSTSLNELTLNGKSLSANVDGKSVQVNSYDPTDTEKKDQAATIAAYLEFKPDIIVLAGTAEAITTVLDPLEAAWPSGEPRPQYVLIDSVKVPELLASAKTDDLRQRIRGTGITPNPASLKVYEAFKLAYSAKFTDGNPGISGMGPTYDATLAVAFSIARAGAQEVTGAVVAQGLRSLSGGAMEFTMGGQQILPAFKKLSAGENITSIGTFAPLEWDNDGAVVGGTIEMWCIAPGSGTPAYKSSGLTFDIKSNTPSGAFTPCL